MTPTILPQERLPLPISPRGGAVGSVVSLSATGLPPQTGLLVAFANLQSYQLLGDLVTDPNGSFSTTAIVPPWAELDGLHYFFVSFSDERPLALSPAFHVTAPDGTARVEGTIETAAEGCLDLKAPGDGLYHLVGGTRQHRTGERIAVVGRIGDAAACGGNGVVITVRDSMSLG